MDGGRAERENGGREEETEGKGGEEPAAGEPSEMTPTGREGKGGDKTEAVNKGPAQTP